MAVAAGGSEDILKELDELDKRLAVLKVAYDKYFLGMEKLEPSRDRADMNKIINDIGTRYVRNTGATFRRDSLKNKFLAYGRYWDRILKQIEEGTYKGHRVKAELHEKERAEREARMKGTQPGVQDPTGVAGTNGNGAKPAAPPPGANGSAPKSDPVGRLLEQFVNAKKKVGENADGLTREKMAAVIQQQSQALKAKYNCKSVEFRVVVEDGKAKLKAIPKA